MNRHLLVVFLASLPAARAQASPLALRLQGTAFGAPVDQSLDVTDGFRGLTITPDARPIGSFPGFGGPAPRAGGSLGSGFDLSVTLTGPGQNAFATLAGPATVGYDRPFTASDLEGAVTGSGTVGGVHAAAWPGAVPAWFTGLSAQAVGSIGGGSLNLVRAKLVVTPGPTPVPEPSTLAGFAAVFGVYALLRRRPAGG